MKQNKIKVIGVGIGDFWVPPSLEDLIQKADLIVGGERIISHFSDPKKETIVIKGGLESVIDRIKVQAGKGKDVVILSDGDPLFFGIGNKIIDAFGRDNVLIFPNISVLQMASARLGISWEHIKTVSLHGRDDILPVLRAMMEHDLVGIYTDRHFDPRRIAKELLDRGIDSFSMIVLENLGQESERIRQFTVEQVLDKDFSPLNFVILKRIKKPEVSLKLGIDDDLYIHKKGLITKKEIRAIALSKLSIQKDNIVWDLGAGCGSVGIEASFFARDGRVFCVEKEKDNILMIKENIKRTGAYIVEPILGEVPYCLEKLPLPDRIFVGGGLSKKNLILDHIIRFLKKGGIMVINVVLMESLRYVLDFFDNKKWPYEITHVSVSRSKEISGNTRLQALNPVFIVTVLRS